METRYYNYEDEELQYNQPRWTALNDCRDPACTFQLRGVNHYDWNTWFFTEGHWNDRGLYASASRTLLDALSHSWSLVAGTEDVLIAETLDVIAVDGLFCPSW